MFKKTVVLNTTRLKPIGKFTFDYKSVLFFTLFLCGLIVGVTFINKGDEALVEFFTKILKNRITAENNNNFLTCFCGDVLPLMLLQLFCYIWGLCAFGIPFIWLAPLVFGLMCGMTIGLYLVNYGIMGLGYCALVKIPAYAITAATLIKCCCESTICSDNIFVYALKGERSENTILKDYTLKYILLCIPLVLAAVLSAGCDKLFSGFFNFL